MLLWDNFVQWFEQQSPIVLLCRISVQRDPALSPVTLLGGAENDGHENDGPSKCPGMKLTDMKLTDMKMQDMFQVSE